MVHDTHVTRLGRLGNHMIHMTRLHQPWHPNWGIVELQE